MITTIAKGQGSRIVEARRAVARDQAQWQALWALHAGPELPAPAVDFRTQMVAAAFAGERPSAGHDLEIASAQQDGDAVDVIVEERQPAPGTVAAQVIVTPFHIVSLPRHEGEVRFTGPAGAGRSRTRDRGGSRAAASGDRPSTTGLQPHVAAALAYLAGPFSGATILLAERTNTYVRFHAWQAIVGLGGLALVALALLIMAFLALFVSPAAFTALYRSSALAAAAWLILWVFCLWNAYTGRRWRMPLVGRFADRRSR